MASRRSPFFALFIIALLGVTVYNAWQVHVLRAEVTDLKKQVAALGSGDRTPVNGDIDSREILAKARKHVDLAKKYVADGELKKAQAELDKSLELAKRFTETSRESSKDAVEQLRKTWEDAGDSIERMWRGVTEKTGSANKKGG